LWIAGQAAQAMGETELARRAYVRALSDGTHRHVTRHLLAKLEDVPTARSMLDALAAESAFDAVRPNEDVRLVGSEMDEAPAALAEGIRSE